MFELDEALDWRAALREHRKARGFTQPRLARESSLSLSALKQYETGQRHPSAEALDAIIAALGLTAEQSSPIRAGAGYAPDMKRIFYDRLGPFELPDLEEQANRYPWPVFVSNIAADILVRHDCGDHSLFVGRILHLEAFARAPLIVHEGRYASLTYSMERAPEWVADFW